MPGIARISDIVIGTCCCHHDPRCRNKIGIIVTGSGDATSNVLGMGRVPDIIVTSCGHTSIIVTGSGQVTTNSMQQGMLSSIVTGCLTGLIVTGSNDATIF